MVINWTAKIPRRLIFLVGFYTFKVEILIRSYYKKGFRSLDTVESFIIDVTPIQYVKDVDLIRDGIKNIHFMNCCWRNLNKFWNSRSQIKLNMKCNT